MVDPRELPPNIPPEVWGAAGLAGDGAGLAAADRLGLLPNMPPDDLPPELLLPPLPI